MHSSLARGTLPAQSLGSTSPLFFLFSSDPPPVPASTSQSGAQASSISSVSLATPFAIRWPSSDSDSYTERGSSRLHPTPSS